MLLELEPSLPGELALDRGPDSAYEAYNEEAFRYFLTVERRRAERAGRSMLLLLVELHGETAAEHLFDQSLSAKLFRAMTTCVREVDFIGWYRAGRIAGAVLAQGPDAPDSQASQLIGERVADVLAERLPLHVSKRLQVRVLQLHSRGRTQS